ncbi:hypothetical protein AAIB33_15385 [Microbacterium sp. AZCO]|uniref:hypothetical protein n=1 Tax=Microbacterium sp. AZCO TaxID=3142976 RepID=UPI0031F3D02C
MRIARSGRFVFVAQWVAAALLPVVFFFGESWLMAEDPSFRSDYAVYSIPVLLIPPVLTLLDGEGRRERSTRVGYDAASVVLWCAIVLGGLTFPLADNGVRDSAIMNTFGISYDAGPSPAFLFAVGLIGVAYLAQLVLAVMGIVRGRNPVHA